MLDTNSTHADDLLIETNAVLAHLELSIIVLDSLLANRQVFLLEAGKVVDAVRADRIEHSIISA